MDPQRQPFLTFERTGWDEVAADYADLTAATVAQVVDPLLDAAGVGAATRVLDVACGPGALAQGALRRGAAALAVDVSAAMVDLARGRVPGLDVRTGAAEALPVDTGSVDAVVSSFGLPHFADPPAAFAEAARVLVPGGRLALSTWQVPAANPLFAVILGALGRAGDLSVAAALPPGDDLFAYADEDRARTELERAGFTDVTVADLALAFPTSDLAVDVERFYRSASVRSRALFERQTPEARSAVLALAVQLADATASPPDQHGVRRLPAVARLVTGTRAG